MMAVSVKVDPTFAAAETAVLFQTTLTSQNILGVRRYAVSADGQRFLVAAAPTSASEGGNSIPITAVVNWTATLRKK